MTPAPPPSEIDLLVARLEQRCAELAGEARTYPGPIARCDDQLPALLERRRNAREALELAQRLRALLAGIDP